jgi:tRNA A-37 threonylcarbamoyl transferase component Bud32
MEYIASGAQADIYKDGSKAIKLFKNNDNKSEVEYEANLQKIAFDYGLPVPEIFDIIEINGKNGIVMEYIEGIPVGNIIMENNFKMEEYLKKSIELQNNVHKIETKKFPLMKDKLQRHILNAKLLTEKNKGKILLKLDNFIFDNKLCHGDFHMLNLIETSNGIKIIDWLCASTGNIEADIYRTYLLYRLFSNEIAEMYLENYCKLFKLNKEGILSWSSIIAGARIGEYIKDEKEKNILLEIIKKEI